MSMDTENKILTEETTPQLPDEAPVLDVSEEVLQMADVIKADEQRRKAAAEEAPEPAEEDPDTAQQTPVLPAADAAASTEPETPSEPAVSELTNDPESEDEETLTEEELTYLDELDRKRAKRKRIFRGALRFYSLLFGFVLCVLILLCCLMMPLRTWLEQYETSQYQHTSSEIYQLLFADPDWALLYDMAGIEATEFEGRDEYVAYMEEKVGDTPLECVEIATGTSAHRRFSIRLAGEEVAAFTMIPLDDGVSTFQRWTFGEVEVYFTRMQSVTVNIMPGYTVYINGVPLDERYTTLKVSTPVEEYLPEGLHGYRWEQQQISGLLVQPQVDVLDEYNNPVLLMRDPLTGIYTVPIANTTPITSIKKDVMLEAIQAEALFSIRAITVADLREYFTAGTQAYTDISSADPVVKSYKSYSFVESATVIDSYYCYSDHLFSARATVKLEVVDKKGKSTTYTTTATYFFTPNSAGNYMVTQRYTEDLQQIVTTVPLRYHSGDALLQTDWVRTDTTAFTPPALPDSSPAVLAWGKMESDGTLTPVLQLQEDGTFCRVEGQNLEATNLYPIFGEVIIAQ